MSDTHCKHGVLTSATNDERASRCFECEPLSSEEVATLRKAHDDWRGSAMTAWREITNLKRRLAFVRGTMKANGLNAAVEYDEDSRRRFERAEKRRARR